MGKDTPLFSIIIPTRNRARFVSDAIKTALAQTFEDFEVIVSNNNSIDNTSGVIENLANDRLTYVSTSQTLSMPDHWEFALSKTCGEWVTLLPDDGVMSPRLLSLIIEAASESSVELVTWQDWPYYMPFIPSRRRNQYVMRPVTGKKEVRDSRAVLRDMFANRYGGIFPRMYNSCCHRNVISRVQQKLGRFFPPPAPDYTSGIATLAVINRYAYLDLPLTLVGSSDTSPHASPAHFSRFVAELKDEARGGFAPIRIPTIKPNTIVAESIFKIKQLMPDELSEIPVDIERYLVDFYIGILRHVDLGFDFRKEEEQLREFLSSQPIPIRVRVRAKMLVKFLSYYLNLKMRPFIFESPLFLRCAEALSKREIIYGDRAGFTDILGALRHVDAQLFHGAPLKGQ